MSNNRIDDVMTTLSQMKTFVCVIQQNSFNQAAKKLGTSAAEVSRRISSLEEQLKVKLINRTTRKLTLTKLGEVYYGDCKKIIASVEDATQKMLSQQREPTGKLSIQYFYFEDIKPILSDFTCKYPKVQLNLYQIEKAPDFKNFPFDLTVGLSESAAIPDNWVRKKLKKSVYCVCCSPNYLAKVGPIKKPSDLSNQRYIAHIGREREGVLHFKNDISIHIEPYLYMSKTEEMIKAALADMGIVMLHKDRVETYLQNNQLTEVLSNYALPAVNRYIVYPYERYLERKIRVFLDCFD